MRWGWGLAVAALTASACLSSANLSGAPDENPDPVVVPPAPTAAPTCTADLQNDVGNCGACGKVCGNQANAYGSCKAGACVIGCNTGFGDCDGKSETGCEATLATDSSHCGVCGKSCGGARCLAGQCQPVAIAEIPYYSSQFAADDTDIYYGFSGGGTNYAIGRVAKDGSKPHAEIVTGLTKNAFGLAVTATEIYWLKSNEAGAMATPDGAIHRAPKVPSTAVPPWLTALRISGGSLIIPDTSAYFATADASPATTYTLYRAALTGTAAVATAQGIKGSVSTFLVDGAFAYYFSNGDNMQVGRGLYRCATSGCATSATIVPGVPANTYLNTLTTQGPHLYFLVNSRTIARMKKDGTEYAAIANTVSSSGYIQAYETDGTRLYWIEQIYSGGGGPEYHTWTCPVANCRDNTQELMLPGEPQTILVDSKAFYLITRTNPGSGTVMVILRVLK